MNTPRLVLILVLFVAGSAFAEDTDSHFEIIKREATSENAKTVLGIIEEQNKVGEFNQIVESLYSRPEIPKLASEIRMARGLPRTIALLKAMESDKKPPLTKKDYELLVPAVLSAFTEDNARVKSGALLTLTTYKQHAISALPILLKEIDSPDSLYRAEVATTVIAIDPSHQQSKEILLTSISAKNGNERLAAARGLEKIASQGDTKGLPKH